MLGADFQGVAIGAERVVVPPETGVGTAEVVERLDVGRISLDRLLVERKRLGMLPLFRQGDAGVVVSGGVVGFRVDRFRKRVERLAVTSLLEEDRTEVVVCEVVFRICADRFPERFDRERVLPQAHIADAHVVVRAVVVRVAGDRPRVMADCLLVPHLVERLISSGSRFRRGGAPGIGRRHDPLRCVLPLILEVADLRAHRLRVLRPRRDRQVSFERRDRVVVPSGLALGDPEVEPDLG